MLRLLRKIGRDRRGNIILIAAASLPVVIGCAGLATDTIQWALWKRQLQRAADSGAISGAYDLGASGTQSTATNAVAHDLTLNLHTPFAVKSGYPLVTFPADSGVSTKQVKVVLAIQQTLPFSSMFMTAAPIITAASTAASVPGSGEYCVVALEKTASQTGITIGGNAKISMDCGMISNSPAANSALSNGTSSSVKATVIAAVGGVQASNSWAVDSYQPYSSAIVDPYASIPAPTPSSCTNFPSTNDLDFTNTTTYPRHASGQVVCYKSDMKIQGQVKLGAATYVLDAASLKMSSTGASISCNGCTIILTSSTADTNPGSIGTVSISGGKVNLIGATTGTYQGMVLYQDRRALDSAGNNLINGNSGSIVQGTLYFPSQQLTYNGDGTSNATCTQFVTRRIIFSGNNTTTNQFAKSSTCPNGSTAGTIGGGKRVRLVA